MILHGRNLIIKTGGVAVAAAKSCTIDVKADEIEVSSPLTGKWKTYIAGRKSWQVDVSGLVMVDQYALLGHLQKIAGWVGETMDLSASIVPSEQIYPGLLPFDGFVTGIMPVTLKLKYPPYGIYWDKDNGRFLAKYREEYYSNWNGASAYMSPSSGAYFATKDAVYEIDDGLVLVSSTSAFSGTALCTDAKVGGAVGNLVTYTAKFKGSGELVFPQ